MAKGTYHTYDFVEAKKVLGFSEPAMPRSVGDFGMVYLIDEAIVSVFLLRYFASEVNLLRNEIEFFEWLKREDIKQMLDDYRPNDERLVGVKPLWCRVYPQFVKIYHSVGG